MRGDSAFPPFRGFSAAALVAAFLAGVPVSASSPVPAGAESLPRFSLSPALDFGIAGTAALLGAGAFALELSEGVSAMPPSPLDPSPVNPLDRPFMRPYSSGLDTVSTALALTALAVPAAFAADPRPDWFPLGAMYAESVALTWGLKELGKNLFPRYRPYLYYPGFPASGADDGDFRQSFPSGHTALAFTAAAFTASAYALYYPDSPWRAPVVSAAYAVAVAAASLRVASGNHFLSDALAGAALGTLSGWLVPALHAKAAGAAGSAGAPAARNRGARSLTVDVLPAGVRCTLRL